MQIKEAVSLAKQYIREVFSEENIDHLGLEEIEYDDQSGTWLITVGFSRPWGEPGTIAAQMAASPFVPRRRDYKV
ncbi:MAG TPA: hypothetical protein VHW90_04005, partial [Stellaceae bacterium]|nr:hypothetical protein [Stellaceae bacterium]